METRPWEIKYRNEEDEVAFVAECYEETTAGESRSVLRATNSH